LNAAGPSRQGNNAIAQGLMATIPTTLSDPIRVADLPLPQDVAQEVEEICRSRPYTRSERAAVEEDIKLRHHYAGHFLIATAGPQGLQIHAIDLDNPEDVKEIYDRLRSQGHRHVLSLYPAPWKDPDGTIVTLNPQS
jgi:hypothetical protein